MTNQEDRNVMKTLMMVVGALTAFFIISIVVARLVSTMSIGEKGVDQWLNLQQSIVLSQWVK